MQEILYNMAKDGRMTAITDKWFGADLFLLGK